MQLADTDNTALAPVADTPPRGRRARKRIVVVGNGMVSFKFCEQMVQRGGHRRFEIVVIGGEPRPAYDRVHLTQYFQHGDADRLALAPREWYADNRIELRTGVRVERIDRDASRIALSDGTELEYHRLVLATGARPFVPPIEGEDTPGVFVYRTIEDLDAIRKHATSEGSSRRAAVIGGGLLGLEASQALRELGQQVQVIERATWLMSQQLDDDSAMVLEEHVRSLGLYIHLGKSTTAIEPTCGGVRLVFAEGDPIEVDTVVISAGIRARHELALDAGLACDTGVAGVIVDDDLRTSDPNIYAIGECASHRGRVYGLVGPGYAMATTLAANLCKRIGRAKPFERGDLSTRLKLLGVEMAVFGDYQSADPAYVWSAPGKRRMIRVRNEHIVGALAVGQWDEVGKLRMAIDGQRKISPAQIGAFLEGGELWGGAAGHSVVHLPDRAMVCNCRQVTAGMMRAQIEGGCGTIERLAQCTGASTVCGSCRPLVAELLGADPGAGGVGGWRAFLFVSTIALVAAIVTILADPIPFAETVQAAMHSIDQLWRNAFFKQASGFTLLGVSIFALLLSVRKRIPRLSIGSYGWWRVAHGVIGISTLIILAVHTGFRMGHNLNFYLMVCFLGLNVVGGMAGLVTGAESMGSTRVGAFARRWRRPLVWAHILLFWPLPALVGLHVATAYFF